MRAVAKWGLMALALLLAACGPDLSGIEEASAYADDVLEHTAVASIACEATTLAVTETARCEGRGAAGQVLVIDGITVLRWSTSDPAILRVSLDGFIVGVSAGVADVIAEGPKGSRATLSITVN